MIHKSLLASTTLVPLLSEVAKRLWPDRKLPTLNIIEGVLLVEGLKFIGCPRPLIVAPIKFTHHDAGEASSHINLIAIGIESNIHFAKKRYDGWNEHVECYLSNLFAFPSKFSGRLDGPVEYYENPLTQYKQLIPSDRSQIKATLPQLKELISNISGIHLDRKTHPAKGVGKHIRL